MRAFIDIGFAGTQVRVHDRRGDWVRGAGVRELGKTAKPPTDGRFRIGSNTKTFVATVVLRLVAEGRIALDTPAADRLPEFGLDRRITVRMLLQHTSGVFNHTGDHYPDGTAVPGFPSTGPEWVADRFRTHQPEELVRLALAKPPLFAPGTDWSYSNTNYALAGLLIEKVTGRPYAEEMRRRILRPLRRRSCSTTSSPSSNTGSTTPRSSRCPSAAARPRAGNPTTRGSPSWPPPWPPTCWPTATCWRRRRACGPGPTPPPGTG